MAICRRIVEAHPGIITATPSALGGRCIRIELPALSETRTRTDPEIIVIYVCKPFSVREVVARVHNLLRRIQQRIQEAEETALEYAGVSLYLDRFLCLVAGRRIELTPVEFRLL